jgi:hypothetical protein
VFEGGYGARLGSSFVFVCSFIGKT